VARYWVNGQLTGEIGQTAIIAGHYGVPMIFVSGGCMATEEAQTLLGQVETATVKWDQSETCAICLSHERACHTIREAAERAVRLIGDAEPYVLQPPIEVRIELKASDYADPYQARGLERVDERTVTTSVESALRIWRF
jgi:D-amino peptidase